jgi:hypothetical protein
MSNLRADPDASREYARCTAVGWRLDACYASRWRAEYRPHARCSISRRVATSDGPSSSRALLGSSHPSGLRLRLGARWPTGRAVPSLLADSRWSPSHSPRRVGPGRPYPCSHSLPAPHDPFSRTHRRPAGREAAGAVESGLTAILPESHLQAIGCADSPLYDTSRLTVTILPDDRQFSVAPFGTDDELVRA